MPSAMKMQIAFVLGSMFIIAALDAQTPELIYYNFDEPGGTTTVNHAVPGVGSNPATVNGHTLGMPGQFGNGLTGVGGSSTTNFIDTGWVTALGTGSWTVGFWFDNSQLMGSTTLQYVFGDVGAGSFRCFQNGVAGTENFMLRGPLTDVTIVGGASISAPTVCAWVYDSTIPEIRGYLNGVLVTTVPQAALTVNGSGLTVAGYTTNTTILPGNRFDEFRLYDRALSSAEIAATWNIPVLGPQCGINSPAMGATTGGLVVIDFDMDHPTMLAVDASFDFSTDAGATWLPATAGGTSTNPTLGIVTPASGLVFEWNSAADLVGVASPTPASLRITGTDPGMMMGNCVVDLVIDNQPSPTCTIMPVTPGTQSLVIDFDIVPDSTSSATVDLTIEYSLDMGLSWRTATAGMGSVNPILGAPIMVPLVFGWDTLADGVGISAPAVGVMVRTTVRGTVFNPGICSALFDVDNSGGVCGDCNGDQVLSVIDALVAAQHSAGVFTVMGPQFNSCNVNGVTGPETVPGATVDVIDALRLAQASAGLPVTLNCNTLPSCAITSPTGGTQVGDVDITFDALDGQGDPLSISFEYDAGGGFVPATASLVSPLSNPAAGVAPSAGLHFLWDSATDLPLTVPGVRFRIMVDDSFAAVTGCNTIFDILNPATPTCVITSPVGGSVNGDVTVDFDASDANMDPLTVTFEYDAGSGFVLATPDATSPLSANPAVGVPPTAGLSFVWASKIDLPISTVTGLTFRVTVDDGITAATTCTTVFDLYNLTLDMLPHAIPPAEINQAYSVTFTPMGGSGTGYAFAVVGGALPAGVTLTAAGVLFGPATISGGFYFTVLLTDSLGLTATREYLLNVRVPEVYLANVGDPIVDNITEVTITNVSTVVPGAPIRTFAAPPALGDAYPTSNGSTKVSPDGRYLAYLADFTIEATDDVYVVDLTSMTPAAVNVTNIVGGGTAEHFEWSPDSLKLAVTGDFITLGVDEYAIINLTAGLPGTRILTQTPIPLGDTLPVGAVNDNSESAWSMDSQKFYFKGDLLLDAVIEAYMFDLNNPGAGAQLLHPALGGLLDVNTIAAAGANMAIIVGDLEIDAEVNIYAVDTTAGVIGTPARINPLFPLGDVGVTAFDSRVAPGGRYVVFIADLQLDGCEDLYIGDLRDGVPGVGTGQPLTNFGNGIFDVGLDSIYWSPSGDRLVFVADATDDAEEEAFFVDVRSGAPSVPVRISAPVTTFEDTDEVRWAPDSSGVTLEGEYSINDIEELYYVNLAGPVPGPLVQLSVMAPVAASDVEGDVVWLPNSSGVVYVHDATRSGLNELYLATPPMSMAAVRIHTMYPSDTGATTVGLSVPNDFFVTRDSQRVVAVGDVFVDNDFVTFMVNLPTMPNLILVQGVVVGGDIFTLALYDYNYR